MSSTLPSSGVDMAEAPDGEYDRLARELFDEYDRLTRELFHLNERKRSIEGTLTGDELDDHGAYQAVTTEIEVVSERMETVIEEAIDRHDPRMVFRTLL